MKTVFKIHFERRPLKRGQTPMATSRLAYNGWGTKEAPCH